MESPEARGSTPPLPSSPVRQINVHEKEDLVLDCELDWHKIATGATGYSFYRVGPSTPSPLGL